MAALAAFLLSGCSLFSPFDSKFQCQRSRDYGKCTNVAGAYDDAVNSDDGQGEVAHAQHQSGDDHDSGAAERHDPAEGDRGRTNLNRYKTDEYGAMAAIIEQPVVPVVTPPKMLRSLVVAYATAEKTLYMPRYIYYFVTDGSFVLGDYLNVEKPKDGGVMYPNGNFEGLR
jgi:conjugal transfer pilus assembly protein TraV